ncbi:MAG: glycosyltransferase family 2 protein [Lachnospiraceae bacterium]|nr:glycosyltransferase family 2 protein [Lachnospiraceae bacterium]
MEKAFISVVMPLYNEEKYIENCINSLLLQDYPKEQMEWIFVDGQSSDNTQKLVNNYKKEYPGLIRLLNNPNKTVPYAMNIGIKASKGKYIIRLDAHADYANDYISKCVYYLDNIDAENVGGAIKTKSRGLIGNAIAKMLSSKFGVGNSEFRTCGSGYVDTVPFGAFRREVFEKFGMYDERLTRNQDNEMNFRIRKNGGKIYLAEDIHLSYYCRDTINGIVDMAVKNGMWNMITMKLCPGSMGIRHFIPLMFVSSILLLPFLSIIYNPFSLLFGSEILLYTVLDIFFGIKQADGIKQFLLLLFLFPLFHISYGLGSMVGFYKILLKKFG